MSIGGPHEVLPPHGGRLDAAVRVQATAATGCSPTASAMSS